MDLKFLILVLLCSSCSFKKDTNQSKFNNQQNLRAKFDWNSTGGFPKDEKYKAIRTLHFDGISAKSSEYITIPEKIPNPLVIINDLPSSRFEAIEFIRAKLILGDREYFMNVDLKKEEEKNTLTFLVNSLESAFNNDLSEKGELRIELYVAGKSKYLFTYLLRTPPNKLTTNFEDLKEAKTNLKTIKTASLSTIQTDKGQANLIQTVSIENKEDYAIEFELPRKPNTKLIQNVVQRNAYGTDCGHPDGVALVNTGSEDVLSDDIYIVPLDENLISELFRVSKNKITNEKFLTRLMPNESAVFGIYGFNDKATSWMNTGPKASNLSLGNFVSSCRKECEPSDHCHGKAGCKEVGLFKVDNIAGICNKNYGYQGHWVGEERGIVFLRNNEDQIFSNIRYADFDLGSDAETRKFNFFKKETEISWIK